MGEDQLNLGSRPIVLPPVACSNTYCRKSCDDLKACDCKDMSGGGSAVVIAEESANKPAQPLGGLLVAGVVAPFPPRSFQRGFDRLCGAALSGLGRLVIEDAEQVVTALGGSEGEPGVT